MTPLRSRREVFYGVLMLTIVLGLCVLAGMFMGPV